MVSLPPDEPLRLVVFSVFGVLVVLGGFVCLPVVVLSAFVVAAAVVSVSVSVSPAVEA